MKRLLYLIGQPGAGKTTILAAALEGLGPLAVAEPFAHQIYFSFERVTGAQLGGQRERFAGTDTLPLNARPKVEAWLASTDVEAIVAEGDWLANRNFFGRVVELGWDLTVCYVCTDDTVAATRRVMRGSGQDPAWVRGRQTKAERLAHAYASKDWWLDGGAPVAWNAERLREHPVVRAIRGGA